MTTDQKIASLKELAGKYKSNHEMQGLIEEVIYLLTDRREDYEDEELDDLINDATEACTNALIEARDELALALGLCS